MSSELLVLQPIPVTDAVLTASNIAENDHPAWNPATSYAEGDRVIRTQTHRIYFRVTPGTSATPPESDTENWADMGATNRWRAFDGVVGTQSARNGEIVITLTPGTVFNGIALLNAKANNIRIKVTATGDGVVYDKTFSMQSPPSMPDYWTYCFEPITQRSTLTPVDMPTYGAGTTVEVTLSAGAGPTAVGTILVGRLVPVGDRGIHLGARIGIDDFSRKETDEYGNTSVTERAWRKRASVSLHLRNSQIDGTQSLFARLRATPTLYIASPNYEALAIYGFYKDFAAVISYPTYSVFELEIEGLI